MKEIPEYNVVSLYDCICEDLNDEHFHFLKWDIDAIRKIIKDALKDEIKHIHFSRLCNKKETGFPGPYREIKIYLKSDIDNKEFKQLDTELANYGLVNIPCDKFLKYEKHIMDFK